MPASWPPSNQFENLFRFCYLNKRKPSKFLAFACCGSIHPLFTRFYCGNCGRRARSLRRRRCLRCRYSGFIEARLEVDGVWRTRQGRAIAVSHLGQAVLQAIRAAKGPDAKSDAKHHD